MSHQHSTSRRSRLHERLTGPLLRRPQDAWLGGICAALSVRFGIPVMPLRIAVIIAAMLITTPVVILYVCAWLFLDTEQEHWEAQFSPAARRAAAYRDPRP